MKRIDGADTATQLAADRAAILRKYLPNSGANSWEGAWPLIQTDPRPDAGVPICYELFEGDDETPAYVGSTANFAERLRGHTSRNGRVAVTRWRAHRHRSMRSAEVHEADLILRRSPRLNRTTGGIVVTSADMARARATQR